MEGLILKSPVYRNFLGAHKDFKEWINKNWNTNLQQLFIESKQVFILEELQSIFSWQNWHYRLEALNELILKNQDAIQQNAISWINSLIEKQKELNEISEKFKEIIFRQSKDNSLIEENELLQKRIKDGANYFYNQISKWSENYCDHPLSVNTKKVAGKIDGLLEEIIIIIEVILQKINFCKEGFKFDEYQKKRKFIDQVNFKKIKSSYSKRNKVKTNTVLETVKYLHEGKNIEQIALERNLTVSTIESHLARSIRQNLIQIEEVMSSEKAQKLAGYFPENFDEIPLAKIKEKVPPEISYGELKIILAWLQSE